MHIFLVSLTQKMMDLDSVPTSTCMMTEVALIKEFELEGCYLIIIYQRVVHSEILNNYSGVH